MVGSLEAAFRYRGCPICHLLEGDEYDFMCQFQGQTIKEEKILRDLVESKGYCNFHFYEMARLTSPIVNAIVTRSLIEQEIKEIAEIANASIWRIDCPVCRYVTQREDFYLREFKALLREKLGQNEYESTDGLCRIHLRKVLNLPDVSELVPFLLLTEQGHLKNLRLELEDFISEKKSTSQRAGKGKNSWWMAIRKIVGKKGLLE